MVSSIPIRLQIRTGSRTEISDITHLVKAELKKSGIQNGICVVFVAHTTCGITINENADPDVQRDILQWMQKVIPEQGDYRHSEGNSDAHIKTILAGNSATMIIANGDLLLGTWQGIYLCEFDGPRQRNIHCKFIGD